MSFLSEADLYHLILKSKLSSAERIQDWVCEEFYPPYVNTKAIALPPSTHKDEGSGLPEFRKAKAGQSNTNSNG
ncbi:MAG: BRO family protein [Candidatus Phlomobacter fragariae]